MRPKGQEECLSCTYQYLFLFPLQTSVNTDITVCSPQRNQHFSLHSKRETVLEIRKSNYQTLTQAPAKSGELLTVRYVWWPWRAQTDAQHSTWGFIRWLTVGVGTEGWSKFSAYRPFCNQTIETITDDSCITLAFNLVLALRFRTLCTFTTNNKS